MDQASKKRTTKLVSSNTENENTSLFPITNPYLLQWLLVEPILMILFSRISFSLLLGFIGICVKSFDTQERMRKPLRPDRELSN
jgi:hypothetical protein